MWRSSALPTLTGQWSIVVPGGRSSRSSLFSSTRDAVTHYFDYATAIVQVKLPMYFYREWVACRLVPANKLDLLDLPPGTTMDHRPVNVGTAERRHITRAYYDEEIQAAYLKVLGPIHL